MDAASSESFSSLITSWFSVRRWALALLFLFILGSFLKFIRSFLKVAVSHGCCTASLEENVTSYEELKIDYIKLDETRQSSEETHSNPRRLSQNGAAALFGSNAPRLHSLLSEEYPRLAGLVTRKHAGTNADRHLDANITASSLHTGWMQKWLICLTTQGHDPPCTYKYIVYVSMLPILCSSLYSQQGDALNHPVFFFSLLRTQHPLVHVPALRVQYSKSTL